MAMISTTFCAALLLTYIAMTSGCDPSPDWTPMDYPTRAQHAPAVLIATFTSTRTESSALSFYSKVYYTLQVHCVLKNSRGYAISDEIEVYAMSPPLCMDTTYGAEVGKKSFVFVEQDHQQDPELKFLNINDEPGIEEYSEKLEQEIRQSVGTSAYMCDVVESDDDGDDGDDGDDDGNNSGNSNDNSGGNDDGDGDDDNDDGNVNDDNADNNGDGNDNDDNQNDDNADNDDVDNDDNISGSNDNNDDSSDNVSDDDEAADGGDNGDSVSSGNVDDNSDDDSLETVDNSYHQDEQQIYTHNTTTASPNMTDGQESLDILDLLEQHGVDKPDLEELWDDLFNGSSDVITRACSRSWWLLLLCVVVCQLGLP